MTTPTVTIHDAETGEIVTREMNAEELAQYEKDIISDQEKLALVEQKKQLRVSALAKLAALGLTEDEANAIISA